MSKTKTTKRQTKLDAILACLTQSKNILVSGHVRPDGDSTGCMIALAHLLNRAGLKAVATADIKNLGAPAFLEGTKKLLPYSEIEKRRFDLIVATDCGSFARLPEPVQAVAEKNVPIVNIDHHRTNTYFGSLNWINARASSTGEMIWRMARKAGWQLDQTAAEALWVAVITDTGRFAYDQTTPATMRCAADLLRHGVRTAFINDRLYCSFSRTAVELKRRAYRTLTISENNEIASVTLTGKDFEETGGTKADAEDVIEIPRSLVGNRVALFFYGNEEDKGETRVSVRTRPPLDATWLAKRFGGGGHERASGFTLQEPLPQAKRNVNSVVAEWLASHPDQAE